MVGTAMPITFRATPSSRHLTGSHCCWIHRSATTDAVLHATTTSVHPSVNSRSMAAQVRFNTSIGGRVP